MILFGARNSGTSDRYEKRHILLRQPLILEVDTRIRYLNSCARPGLVALVSSNNPSIFPAPSAAREFSCFPCRCGSVRQEHVAPHRLDASHTPYPRLLWIAKQMPALSIQAALPLRFVSARVKGSTRSYST